MKTEDAISALKELATNNSKRSKIGQIRELMPYIEEAMAAGVTLETIHETLTEKCGLDIKLITFIGSYRRIKKEQKEGVKKTAATQKYKTHEDSQSQEGKENKKTKLSENIQKSEASDAKSLFADVALKPDEDKHNPLARKFT